MILKLLLVLVVILVVYTLFFKKRAIEGPAKQRPRPKKKRKQVVDDEMIACAKCGTYVAVDDAFIKSGRYYCSKECMNS